MFEPLSYFSENYEELFQYYECDGCIWYSYDHLMDKLGYSDRQKDNCWKQFIQEDEKRIFIEEYHTRTKEYKYINSIALFYNFVKISIQTIRQI